MWEKGGGGGGIKNELGALNDLQFRNQEMKLL